MPSVDRPRNGSIQVITWDGLGQGTPTGDASESAEYSDKSVQVSGNFAGPATVVLQGSNDGVNWVTLTDPLGNALSFTAAGLKQVIEITRFVRPNVTGSNGTTDIDVTLLASRPTPMRT